MTATRNGSDRAVIAPHTESPTVGRNHQPTTKMKRLLIGLPFLLLALGPVSCSDTAEEPILVPEPVEITLTPSDRLIFEPDGGTLTLTVDAKGANWKVEKSDAWINVAPNIAAGTVEVTAQA